MHMFDKYQTQRWYNDSTIYINYCLPPSNDKWGMIILIDEDTIKVGQENNSKIIFRGDTITLSNSIDQYDPIGILGNSGQYKSSNGVWKDYVAHLHLNTISDAMNTAGGDPLNRDPCEFIKYDTPTYEIKIRSQLSNSGIVVKYPGDKHTKIRVRAQMKDENVNVGRYNHLMDVNNVELYLKPSSQSDFTRIIGGSDSAIISLGARIGENVRNHDLNNNYPGQIHLWKKTGVNSNAYNNGVPSGPNARNPWDDYYFIDFPTRIHKNSVFGTDPTLIAALPEDARYNDGKYELKSVVTTVRNTKQSGPKDSLDNIQALSFVLDNFKPYIKRVSASLLLASPFYDKEWKKYGTEIELTNNLSSTPSLNPYSLLPIYVSVTSSEPLNMYNYPIS